MRRAVLAALAALAVPAATLSSAPAQEPAPVAEHCAALADLAINDANLLSASVVPAAEGLPEFCRVLGYVRPAINFEVRLPTADWNGKVYMVGCGGFCGQLESDRAGFINAMNSGLRRGYASVAMDSGHWGASSADGRWAHHNRLAEIDWGRRAVPATARVALVLTEAFYGRAPAQRYFQGCSTGGRMALMAAQQTPELFDGIIAGAPALDYTGLVATFFAALVQANTGPDGTDIVTPNVVPLVRDAVYAACDGADGLEDGLIADPRRCTFDPAGLQCAADEGEDCLTAAQVETLRTWYDGARDSVGERLYPGGIPYGSEPFWWLWLAGDGQGNGRLIPAFNADFLRYMAFQDDPGAGYGPLDFDLDTDPARLAFMSAIYNADDPDLTAFSDAGGRLLMWHGWADAIVTPWRTLDYFAAVQDAAGGAGAAAEFVRLFMVPGMDHCGLLARPRHRPGRVRPAGGAGGLGGARRAAGSAAVGAHQCRRHGRLEPAAVPVSAGGSLHRRRRSDRRGQLRVCGPVARLLRGPAGPHPA